MGMTIEEIIAKEIETAQEFQKVIDTHIISDNFSLEEMYCDDDEVIEEHLQRYKVSADYHNQIAETMRKYQKIEELAEYHMLRFLPKERMSSFQKDILEVLENGNDR